MRLPSFEYTACRNITLCGRIMVPDHALQKPLPDAEPLVAAYRAAGQKVFFRVLPGGKEHTHLHVDCAVQGYFAKHRTPKTNTTKTKLLSILRQAMGSRLDVAVAGGFIVPLSDLPEQGLIRSLSAGQRKGGLSARLTSGACIIEGASIQHMSWYIEDEQQNVFVNIKARREFEVDEHYIEQSLHWIEEQFRLVVLGEVADANS